MRKGVQARSGERSRGNNSNEYMGSIGRVMARKKEEGINIRAGYWVTTNRGI